MVATLPGRTQGLGLITEPLLTDLQLDRVSYAKLNLWATLLGALACFPAGWAIDRFGLRWITVAIITALSAVVWQFTALTGASIVMLFSLLLATRALGQSALSVCSITLVGKVFRERIGVGMGVYSVLLSVWFAIAFVVIGYAVRVHGWRAAWLYIALALVFVVVPLVLWLLRDPLAVGRIAPCGPLTAKKGARIDDDGARGATRPAFQGSAPFEDTTQLQPRSELAGEDRSFTLAEALRTRAFWVFALAAALFNLVASGLGLFNEAVLAQQGFARKTFHVFLAVTTLLSLGGQFACGWLSTRVSFQKLTCSALLLYSVGLSAVPFTRSLMMLWIVAALIGVAAGMIIVVFFSIWSEAFGRAHLGRIQGAAQMITVISSALGPVLFAECFEAYRSYTPVLWGLAVAVLGLAALALMVKLPGRNDSGN